MSLSSKRVIALDAMGGDFTPKEPVAGAVQALRDDAGLKVLLVGDEPKLQKELAKVSDDLKDRAIVVPSDGVVSENESPVRAMKTKPSASVFTSANCVCEEEAEAFISMGNTGASFVAAQLAFGTLNGVDRAVISSRIQPFKGKSEVSIADVGATVDARPRHMLTFAALATASLKILPGIKDPSVALLNVGKERGKGNELVKAASKLFEKSGLNYIGFVEPTDVLEGVANVVVCDGFVGNIFLKVHEAILDGVHKLVVKHTDGDNEITRQITQIGSPAGIYGATPLLGLDRIALVGHGASLRDRYTKAIKTAKTMLDLNLIGAQKEALCTINV